MLWNEEIVRHAGLAWGRVARVRGQWAKVEEVYTQRRAQQGV